MKKQMYIQPKVEEMVLPLDPFMLSEVSGGGTVPDEEEPAHAPQRKKNVF